MYWTSLSLLPTSSMEADRRVMHVACSIVDVQGREVDAIVCSLAAEQ